MALSERTVSLPSELDGITAAFVSAALSRKHPGTAVEGVEVVDLRQGSASSLRLRLAYAANPFALPPTMFLKGDFVDHDFTSAAAFAAEARYFMHLASTFDDTISQPRAFFADVDDAGQAIVIMADLAADDVRFGDCEEPLDVDTVADGVRQLAAMQSSYWRGRGLEGLPWITDIESVAALMGFLVGPAHFDDYIERERADFLPAELKNRLKIEAAFKGMLATDGDLPRALVHGDAHVGNTFRDSRGRLGFCDFQAMGRGPFIWDVTYFLTGALRPEHRSVAERDLLTLYLDELHRSGADDVPDLNATFLAHRRHMMHGYFNILTPTEMQPDRFAVSMGKRFATAMQDLDTLGSFDT